MGFLNREKRKKTKRHSFYDSKNQKTDDTLIKIFRPGRKVDVVFYMDSSFPVVRSAIIHDCDYDSRTIIISQTDPVILSSTRYEKMGITSLIAIDSNQTKRVGIACKIAEFIRDYSISDKIQENAIAIKYAQPIEEFNLREAYRFEPQIACEVMGKIILNGRAFFSKEDFKVHNISTGGVGLIVENSKRNVRKPLLQMQVNETMNTELDLISFKSMKYEKTVPATAGVVWKNLSYSRNYGYIGTKFVKMDRKQEKFLHQFVHNGQLYSIRKNQAFSS